VQIVGDDLLVTNPTVSILFVSSWDSSIYVFLGGK
jgi:hypothetical protein